MEAIAMADRFQKKDVRKSKQDRERGADYYLGLSEEDLNDEEEADAPYKLEPNVTEIENFLSRLRQEGL